MKPSFVIIHIGTASGIDYIVLDTLLILFSFAIIIGYYGKKKEIGFQKAFLNSLFLTPVGGMIMVGISRKLITCNSCGTMYKSINDFCPECNKNEDGFTKEEVEEMATNKVTENSTFESFIKSAN
jgi:hypothetical protein